MTVRWEKVKRAEEYLILVFDCSLQLNKKGLLYTTFHGKKLHNRLSLRIFCIIFMFILNLIDF